MNNKLSTTLFLVLTILAGSPFANASETTAVDVTVTEDGFVPNSIKVKPGSEVVLKVTRKTDLTCANEILVPSKKVNVKLPLNKTVTVNLGKLEKGEIKFGCAMDMMVGGLISVR